jgi:ABC-type antimicrobial peptide transport system permease subunit
MRIPLLRGRNLFPDEKHAIIVGEGLARQQWPGEDPIGKQFWDNDTVVGIAGSARIIDIADDDALEVYHAAHVEDMPQMLVIVQIAGSPDSVLSQVRSISTSLDPKVLPYIRILKSEFNDRMKIGQRIALIVSVLGLVAVSIACIGITGLVAYAVSQRLKEIAIRMALGAKRAQVLVAVLRQFMLPVVFGTVFGVGLAAVVSRMLRRILFGLSNLDAVSYAAAVVVLLAILVVAALLPARRALLLDVAKVLHYE